MIFFVAVLLAGLTSLINLYEAPIATVQEKLHLGRVQACAVIAVIGAVISVVIQGIVSDWMDVLSIYICPLGAFYSVFNKVSFFKYRVNKEKCVGCGKCAKVCRMQVDPVVNANSLECIRCGRCKQACPTGAISCGVSREKNNI